MSLLYIITPHYNAFGESSLFEAVKPLHGGGIFTSVQPVNSRAPAFQQLFNSNEIGITSYLSEARHSVKFLTCTIYLDLYNNSVVSIK